jgi:LPS-assembly protein
VYFYGAEIEKVGVDKYRITKGGFTTCVQPTPRWQIVSGRATVNLNDYVMMKNAVVRVKDVPVFYLPIMYYPIQEDDRATGFLLPTYATSTYSGGSMSNAFFWAINRSQDVTVFHDWFFSGSTGFGTEYRYLLGPAAQGNFRAYSLDEKEREVDGALRPARQSKIYSGGLSQGLPLGLTARGNLDYSTDIATQQLYSNSFTQATTSRRTINGAVAGAWGGLSVNSVFNRTEYFYTTTDSQVSGRAPGFSAAYAARKLPRLPVYFSVNGDAAKVLYITKNATTTLDNGVNTVDLLPSIRAPLSKLPFLSVNASLAYRRTYFSESLDANKVQVEVPITREYADMRAEVVGPVFSRVFSPNNGYASRLKHVIEPSYSVQKRTTIAVQDQMPLSVSEIIIGGTTQFTYGLANRVLMRRDSADPTEKVSREILNVQIRQSYYTDEKASQYDTSYGYGYLYRPASPFSPIALSARSTPLKPVGVDFRFEYDPRAEATVKVVGFGLNGTYVTNRANVSAGWTRVNYGTAAAGASNNYITQTTQFNFAEGTYGGTVSFNYDFTRATLVNHRYVAFYNAQCCGVSFEYIAYNYGSGTTLLIPQNRRFNMSFTLAGVGSFSNFFGAFGGGS